MNLPFCKQILDTPNDVCFETLAKRRRFDYSASGIASDNGESSSMASSPIGCNSPDRFLPNLTSKIPFFPLPTASIYAAELLSLVDSTYRQPLPSQASSDPTLLSRLYHSQSLGIKRLPVPSRYSVIQNARSSPDFEFNMKDRDYYPAVHPCAWSCRNVIAGIMWGDVHVRNIENGVGFKFRKCDAARSVEYLPDHTLVVGDHTGEIVFIDTDTARRKRTFAYPTDKNAITWSINTLDFSREHNLLAAGGCGVTSYDPRIHRRIWSIRSDLEATTVRWSPDGLYLAIGGGRGDIRCLDARTRKTFSLILPPEPDGPPVGRFTKKTCVAWAPWESHLLATSGLHEHYMVHLWTLSSSGKSNHCYRHLQSTALFSEITSLHFSPHIRELLTTYGSAPKPPRRRRHPRSIPSVPPPPRGIAVFSYPSFKLVHSAEAHEGCIVDSVLSANGTSLLTYGKDGMLRTWTIWGERKKEKSFDKLGIR